MTDNVQHQAFDLGTIAEVGFGIDQVRTPPTCFALDMQPPNVTLADNNNRLRSRLQESTTSWTDITEYDPELLRAQGRAATVKIEDATENLFEIRLLTGFAWSVLANLLNVDRRTLHNWTKGEKIRRQNQEHVAKTLKVLRFADRGSTEYNAASLNEECRQNKFVISPFEAIRARNYSLAMQILSHGLGRPTPQQADAPTMYWSGEFQPMMIHPDADGTDSIETLSYEPEPASYKRAIRRR